MTLLRHASDQLAAMTEATMTEAADTSEIFRVADNILQEQVREGLAKIEAAQASAHAANQIQVANTQSTLAKLLQHFRPGGTRSRSKAWIFANDEGKYAVQGTEEQHFIQRQ